ncbi:MAG: hypothetical protein QXV17_08195 [Candidatus Micrarchaeaceae archaeon]
MVTKKELYKENEELKKQIAELKGQKVKRKKRLTKAIKEDIEDRFKNGYSKSFIDKYSYLQYPDVNQESIENYWKSLTKNESDVKTRHSSLKYLRKYGKDYQKHREYGILYRLKITKEYEALSPEQKKKYDYEHHLNEPLDYDDLEDWYEKNYGE